VEKQKKPDFLVVGAAKSGTTSLFHYLNQHPDVYIPEVKECRFFSQLPKNFNGLGAEFFPNSGITDKKEYFKLFANNDCKVSGDISNDYLYYYEESIKNIKKYLADDVTIVIILRNPVDRAYSNYLHAYRDDWEVLSFEQAIIEEQYRINNNWAWPYHYIKTGFYYKQVKSYLENFSHVKIFLYEDLNDMQRFMDNIFLFLGVNSITFAQNSTRYNASGYPKNKIIHKFVNSNSTLIKVLKPIGKKLLPDNFIMKLKNKNLTKKPLSDKTRLYLEGIYSDDIKKLSELIDRNLDHWFNS